MRKSISILGSTGSVGVSTLSIIDKKKKLGVNPALIQSYGVINSMLSSKKPFSDRVLYGVRKPLAPGSLTLVECKPI